MDDALLEREPRTAQKTERQPERFRLHQEILLLVDIVDSELMY